MTDPRREEVFDNSGPNPNPDDMPTVDSNSGPLNPAESVVDTSQPDETVARQAAAVHRGEDPREVVERDQAERARAAGAPSGGGYADQTVDQLQAEAARRGLPKSGTKDELVSRLEEDDRS